MLPAMSLRVGIDLVSVGDVEASLARHGEHYLRRVYTGREVDDCRDADGVAAERLAARFAAKEAAMKALRVRDEAIPWNSIEVRRDPAGWTELVLHDAAAELASARGIAELAVSLTHEAGYASAVVIAESGADSRYFAHER